MAHEEKAAWVMAVVSVIAYSTYVVLVLQRAGGAPLAEASYAVPLLGTIGGAIVAQILAHIAISIASPEDAGQRDVRDREIGRFGEYVGQSFLVIGGLAALLMALAEWDHFWIANAIYLMFVLSGVVGSIAKIAAYRGGLPQW